MPLCVYVCTCVHACVACMCGRMCMCMCGRVYACARVNIVSVYCRLNHHQLSSWVVRCEVMWFAVKDETVVLTGLQLYLSMYLSI